MLEGVVEASALALPCERLSCLQEYYKAVSEALAVLPAFSSDAYYTRKASSSVATAIICGRCCLVVNPALGQKLLSVPVWIFLTGSSHVA